MDAKSTLRLQSIILLVLIPTLLLVVLVMGALIYKDLYATILRGFDKKLSAVSSTASAFIDGDEHDRIYRKRRVTGLAFDPKTNLLYGADAETGSLVIVDTETGGAVDVRRIGDQPMGDLAFDPRAGRLYGLTTKGLLVAIETRSGRRTPVGKTDPTLRGLEFDPRTNTLWGSGRRLVRIDPRTGATTPIGDIGFTEVRGLALHPRTGKLYGSDAATGALLRLDPRTGKGTRIANLAPRPKDLGETITPVTAAGLAFDPGTGSLYGASRGLMQKDKAVEELDADLKRNATADRLLKIDPATGQALLSDYTIGYRNENSALYTGYIAAMRRTKEKAGLTFIFTQTVPEGKLFRYVLDEAEKEFHAAIGDPDVTPDEEDARSLREAAAKDAVYVSRIKQWEDWGILKSAYAPIHSRRSPNQVRALVGIDIDVGLIRTKTSVALAQVGIVALASLLVGGFIAIFIARRLTLPLARVKDVAIQVAAGQYGHQIEVREPWELAELSRSFNRMSRTLSNTVRDLTEANRSLEQRRRRQELNRVLAQDVATERSALPAAPTDRLAHAWLGGRAHCADSSGCVLSTDGRQLLVWLADSPRDTLEALKLRGDITLIARSILDRHERDWDAQSARLAGLFTKQVYCWVLLDAAAGTVRALTRRATPALVLGDGQPAHRIDLAAVSSLTLAPGQAVVVASAGEMSAPAAPLAGAARTVLADVEAAYAPATGGAEDEEPRAGLIAALTGNASVAASENGRPS